MKKLLLAAMLLLSSAFVFAAVNINTATQAELENLSGIGPVKAKAIIDDRTKNGPFKSVDDLDRVKGIGKATIDNLRKDLSVSGATKAAAADTAKKDTPKAAPAPAATAKSAPAPVVAKAEAPKAEAAKAPGTATAAAKADAPKAAAAAAAKDAKPTEASADAKKDAPKK